MDGHCTIKKKREGNRMIPLTMAAAGETLTIGRISGKDAVRQHLEELGLVTGTQVTVVAQMAGNLILQVKGGRVALDRSMAGRIMAAPCGQTDHAGFQAAPAHM